MPGDPCGYVPDRIRGERTPSRLLILGWHNVSGTWCFPSRSGSGYSGLKQQLRFLQRVFHVVPLEPALEQLAVGKRLPPRSVALTFDDGYRDNLELAVPLLRELRLPATFFLVPGLLSREVEPWWEVVSWAFTGSTTDFLEWEGGRYALDGEAERRAALLPVTEALKRRDTPAREAALADLVDRLRPAGRRPGVELFLDWNGADDLLRAGFDIGSHTYSHPILGNETGAVLRRELVESRSALEDRLKVTVSGLAYPNGRRVDYGPETIDAAADAGYRYALTTEHGWNRSDSPPYELRRSVMFPERGLQGLLALIPVARRARRLARKVCGRAGGSNTRPVAS